MSRNSLPPVEHWERKRVGAIIRTIREARGITPDEFANRVNKSRAFLMNVEAGRKQLPPSLVEAVCDALSTPEKKVDPIVFAKAGAITEAA